MDQEKPGPFWAAVITVLVMAVLLFALMLFDVGCKKYINSKQTNTTTMIALIETGLQEFLLDNERFPTQEEGLEVLLVGPNELEETWDGPYIDERRLIDAWGYSFIYRIPAEWSDDEYDLISYGRDGTLGGEGNDRDLYNYTRD